MFITIWRLSQQRKFYNIRIIILKTLGNKNQSTKKVVDLKRLLFVFYHNILKRHNWIVVEQTSMTKYYKCKSCGQKQVRQKLGGYQPIDWQYLNYPKTDNPEPPKSFYILNGKYAVYSECQKHV